jgi:aryl-alcohol dehydrogenase-like predicted oxidoreductase
MEFRDLGTTGVSISALGLGAGALGEDRLDDAGARRLLNQALDMGINYIDTARSYGESEARIGRFLAHRRGEFLLSTKVGYGIRGVGDWTGDAVSQGIDEALATLNTDHLDVAHLHSCGREVLERGEVIEALVRAQEAGKVRLAGYAGDNEALEYAVGTGAFQVITASANPFDQRFPGAPLGIAKAWGHGVVAKRPLGNAPWRFHSRPTGRYCEAYWDRMVAMGLDFGDRWPEIALRFVVFTWGIDCAITGTTSAEHLAQSAAWIAKGRLDEPLIDALKAAFSAADQGWRGQT